jgi:hypothetical protein
MKIVFAVLCLFMLCNNVLHAQDSTKIRKNRFSSVWGPGNTSIISIGSKLNDNNVNYSSLSIGLEYERVLGKDGFLAIRTGFFENIRKGSYYKDNDFTHLLTLTEYTFDIPFLFTFDHDGEGIYPTLALGPDVVIPVEDLTGSMNQVTRAPLSPVHVAVEGAVGLNFKRKRYSYSVGFYEFKELSPTRINFAQFTPYVSWGTLF